MTRQPPWKERRVESSQDRDNEWYRFEAALKAQKAQMRRDLTAEPGKTSHYRLEKLMKLNERICLPIFQTTMGAPVYATTTSCWGFRSQTSFRRYPIHQLSTQEDSLGRGKGTTGRVWVCATTTEKWAKTRLSTRYYWYIRVITGCCVIEMLILTMLFFNFSMKRVRPKNPHQCF